MLKIINSEWVKARSIKSTWIIIVLNLAFVSGISFLVGNRRSASWQDDAPHESVWSLTQIGSIMAIIPLMVFAVMTVTSEYQSNTISTTLLATPNRLLEFISKTVFVTLFIAVNATISLLVGFFAGYIAAPNFSKGQTFLDTFTDEITYYFALTILATVIFAIFVLFLGYIIRNIAATMVIAMLCATNFISGILSLANVFFKSDFICHLINVIPDKLFQEITVVPDQASQTLSQAVTDDGSYVGFHTIEPLTNGQATIAFVILTAVVGAIALLLFKKRDV